MAAAGLSRSRRACRHQRGAGKDALQPHCRGQAARNNVSCDALSDGKVGHQIARIRLLGEMNSRSYAKSSARRGTRLSIALSSTAFTVGVAAASPAIADPPASADLPKSWAAL